jgi:hypothetical protein
MGMKLIKKQGDYRIYRRRDDRYAVKGHHDAAVNGEEKVAVLTEAGLLSAPAPKAPEPAPAEAAEAEGTEAEAGDGEESAAE